MDYRVVPVPSRGAEDVVVTLDGPDEGAVFTGAEDGTIYFSDSSTIHPIDEWRDGRLAHDLPIDDAECRTRFHMVTGVREHDGRIWMGSLQEAAVAVLTP